MNDGNVYSERGRASREYNLSNTKRNFIRRRHQADHYIDPKNKSVIYHPTARIFSVNLRMEIIFNGSPQYERGVLHVKIDDVVLFSSEMIQGQLC